MPRQQQQRQSEDFDCSWSSSRTEPPQPSAAAKSSDSPSASPSIQHQMSHQVNGSSSPAHASNAPQPPAIPGLFLASTSSPGPSTTSHNPTIYGASQGNQRKRPVAADFDTPASTMPFKRPFGQNRSDHSLVIHVSDEEPDTEDEDVAMDLESQADQESPVQTATKLSDHGTPTYRISLLYPTFPRGRHSIRLLSLLQQSRPQSTMVHRGQAWATLTFSNRRRLRSSS